ncbi:MAG: acyloxyacyl hydrolase [Candidatus Omnitrophota bacterium]
MKIDAKKLSFIILLGVFFAFSNCQADEQEEKPPALLYRKNSISDTTTWGLLRGLKATPLKGDRESRRRRDDHQRDEVPMENSARAKRVPILQGIEFFTGFARTNLHFKADYCFVPLIVDFDFGLKDLADKIGFNPPGLLQFQLEPYLGLVSQPDTNVELGNSFFLKMGILPETFKLQPYIKFGPGLAYMTQHIREQSTQFNFTETGVVGMQYLFTKNNSFAVEFRYRHLSNAGMDRPNHGINTYLIAAGISRQF